MDDSVGLISRANWKATRKEDLTLFLVGAFFVAKCDYG